MEAEGSEFVKHRRFHHVLKYFDPEEMLKLRTVNTTMRDRVTEELFSTQDIFLHESTFTEELGARIKNTKNLKIEGIQLRAETDTLFNGLEDNLFKNLDELEMCFTTDEDTHESVGTIVEKLKHPINMHTLKITIWEQSFIGALFRGLADEDLPMFKTVRTLEVITHNNMTGGEDLEEFISKFEQLDRLQAFPNQAFNPFRKVSKAIPRLCIWTPDTQENCNLVTEFVDNFPPEDLELEYIQFDEREYNFKKIEGLKRLKL
jgi:hypothetical protein